MSPIVPVLVAVLVCDVAVVDPSSGKKNLIGIFDKVFAFKFPTTRHLSIYVKLADAQGFYKMVIRFVHLNSGKTLAEVGAQFDAQDRLGTIDGVTPPVPFPLPEPGRYEFQVYANDVFLGSATLDAEPVRGAGGGN